MMTPTMTPPPTMTRTDNMILMCLSCYAGITKNILHTKKKCLPEENVAVRNIASFVGVYTSLDFEVKSYPLTQHSGLNF